MMKKLKMGMIGGGQGAFIGAIHRIAAAIDGLIVLHCGAFSSSPEKSKLSGAELGLDAELCYGSYEEMIKTESEKSVDERMDFVSIVTPNHAHFAPAMMAMEYGFDVMIDKPITLNLEQAKALEHQMKVTGRKLALTHTYAGYPMVKQARFMIANGDFGKIRKVMVQYPQGWLSDLVEQSGSKQATWRTDPTKSGIAGCMGDIGTHAAHLAEYMSGLKITKLCADLNVVVAGRNLDDDGNVLLKFDNGANGILVASQICAGVENALKIEIYGEKGGVEWHQMEPNTLYVKWKDAPMQVFRAGQPYLAAVAQANSRTPGGHPEGYLEAFANIYRNFALTLMGKSDPNLDYPSIEEGIRGMAFIENVVASSKSDVKWWDFKV